MMAPEDAHRWLEAAASKAEGECRAGRWDNGLRDYIDLITESLAQGSIVSREATMLTGAQEWVLRRVADLATLLGHASAADHLFQGLAIAYRRAGNEFAADCATLKIWHVAISRGDRSRVEMALTALEPVVGSFDQIPFVGKGLAQWESRCNCDNQPGPGGRAYFFAQFYLEAGRLFLSIGQYSDATSALRRGLVHSTHEAAARFAQPLNLELVAGAVEQANFKEAETLLALVLTQLAPERHPGFVVRAWELDAQRQAMQGNFGGALSVLERVRNLCRNCGLRPAEATTSINIAQLLIILNQTVAASALLAASREVATQLHDHALAKRAARLLELARARRTSTRGGLLIAPPVSKFWRAEAAAEAEEDARTVLTGFSDADSASFFDRFNDYALGHQWLLSRGLLSRAQDWLAQMREIFSVSDSPLVQLRLRVLDAMQRYYGKDFEGAEAAFTRAREELRTRGLKHELWQADRFAIWSQSRLGHPRDPALTREAEQLLDQISETLDCRQRILFQLNKATSEEERLDTSLDELINEAKASERNSWPRRWIARWRLWTRVHAFKETATRARESVVRGSLSLPLTEKEAPSSESAFWRDLIFHPWRNATVFFVVLPDRIAIIRTTFFSIAFGVSPVTRVQLREWVQGWHQSLAQGEEGSQRALDFAEIVGEALQFAEILAALPRRVRALVVVPDDVLHGVPFSALYKSSGFRLNARNQPERFVVNLYPVTIRIGTQTPHPSMARHGRAELLAAGLGEAIGNFPMLGHVREELACVSNQFASYDTRVSCLLDHDATVSAVAEGLSRATYAHLACHGTFDPGDLHRTGLVLHGIAGQPAILSLPHLAQLDLRGLRHITLASCWSADNYILPGRWVLSLPQTLATAGVHSVLSSLWAIDDEVAAAFVRRFYEYARRLRSGSALRQTQLDCLQNTLFPHGDRNTADAFFWACFTLSGETGRL